MNARQQEDSKDISLPDTVKAITKFIQFMVATLRMLQTTVNDDITVCSTKMLCRAVAKTVT